MARELETTGFEFGTEEREDRIPPHGFEGVMVEVGMGNPLLVIEGKAPDGGGEETKIAFQIPSERVDGQEDAGQEAPLGGELFDEVGGKWGEEVKKMAIDPEEGLQWFGECPGDMLPDGVGEGVERSFDPVVGGLFPAGGTETGFAGMRGLMLRRQVGQRRHANRGTSFDRRAFSAH